MIDVSLKVELSFKEVCEITEVPDEVLITFVEEGLIEPQGESPEDWCFDACMLDIARRAARLHRDFAIEWSGIPLYLDMLEQLEKLREENRKLRQRLARFLEE